MATQVKNVSYSQFINDVKDDKVKKVQLNTSSNEISYTIGEGADTEEYKTTAWPDDSSLVSTLEQHKVEMVAQILRVRIINTILFFMSTPSLLKDF